ncbi:TonB-dependent receptor [Mucilaginibacter paludis]|uniref:TonB-dependent receptor plug n=1 Tax=Mucilaginibacter paludis DSM 18603 TaxID=714943 RepID=H1Y884_9SPHI|nr:TonB-dependent receptor [Mucilaginibacter paludis]EHQ24903.1 TonB-dependent receptor plug [Mucilaginibacter paludis DSM 18603]
MRINLSALLILFGLLQASANVYSQKISISERNISLEKVFESIENQSAYTFLYDDQQLQNGHKISISLRDASLESVLNECFKNQPFSFKIIEKTIVISSNNDQVKYPVRISGVVYDENSQPLPGVTIKSKNGQAITVTDKDGKFEMVVTDLNSPLVCSYIGYNSKEISIGNQRLLKIVLQPSVKSLNDVVVVGYGINTQRQVSGSIGSVKAKDLKDQPVTSFDQAMAGKIAGVRVLQTSGSPGAALSIRVRGLNSISAGNDPLYVIDGVPLSNDIKSATGTTSSNIPDNPINVLSSLNIDDIESISVLKDASSAAIYGSRASNGVVLITTKHGKAGKPVVKYDTYYGWQSVAKKIDLLDAYQYAKMALDARNNAYLDANPAGSINDPNSVRPSAGQIPPNLLPYLQGQTGLTNTDWQDQIFRRAPIQSHTLSVSGGNNSTNYYLSGNYLDQKGVVIGSSYSRYSTRFNLDSKSGKLHFGVNMNPTVTINNLINSEGPYFDEGIIGLAQTLPPIYPVYNPDGSYNFSGNVQGYGLSSILNPVALANEVKDKLQQISILGNTFAEYEFIKGLKYKISLGVDLNAFHRDYFRPTDLEIANVKGPSIGTGISRSEQFIDWLVENTLNYNKAFGKHTLDLLAGFSTQKDNDTYNYLSSSNFPNNLVQTLNAGQISSGGSSLQQWSLISYIGRAQYNYDNKYFATASIRSDGSSRFGPNHKYGYFPSASVGWLVSQEEFLKNNKIISTLKLKASYGLTGNFQIPNYGSYGLINYNNYVLGNNVITSGVIPKTASNDNLTWEKTAMLNTGFDLGLFHDKLFLEAEYYDSNTSNLLLNVNVPQITGFSTQLQNLGKVNNRGVEATLSAQVISGKFEWTSSFNIAANKNRVKALGPAGDPIIVAGGTANTYFITQIGSPIGSYYLMKVDGVFKNQSEIDNYPHLANTKPGDFKFVDVNGDGKIDLSSDRTIVGSYLPSYTFGFTNSFAYKGLDLSVAVQGVQGNQIVNLNRRYLFNVDGNMNQMVGVLDRWMSPSDPGNGLVNRANRSPTGSNGTTSTWHVEDGSYVRIRNIALGYQLPLKWVQKAGIAKLRIYCSLQNPFTFTKFTGYNPEVSNRPDNALSSGEDYGTYPLSKTTTLGLSVTF